MRLDWRALGLAMAVLTSGALAHDGVVHGTAEEAAAHDAATGSRPPTPALPFPVEIRAEFDLIDQDGEPVRAADLIGRPMAIFFGYASCEAICSVALPRLGEALDLLGEDAEGLEALMITIDPARDTVETMGPALAKWHPRLRGLTGTDGALTAARAAFQVEISKVFDDPEGNPIYAHGSFIYLVGRDGKVATLLPPVLGPERMAEIMRGYL